MGCEFKNEPDTDFILESNRKWSHRIRQKWKKNPEEELTTVPLIVGGRSRTEDREIIKQMDKSQKNVFCGQYAKATAHDLQEAVRVAKEDPDYWQKLSTEDRCRILSRVASQVRKKRGDLIGVAAAEVGKVFTETDIEVSEAVDFLEFYSHSARYFESWKNLKFRGKGVGLVVPPWNFPIAIPVGGIAACLAAGNRVILKPSSRAVLCAYEICRCFWMGGVSQNVLQFVPCPGDLAQEHLVKDRGIDFVILTGGESTARKMLESRADLFLTAETGGKNATIVTALADREQAIKNVIHSAFSNSGQKCSATSLLVLEDEVYSDQKFRETLVDAACSLKVGSVWNFENKIGTLAGPVDGALKHAIENLEEGESWALKPSYANGNPFMLGPAIKWGVREGSFCHKTELFGPVLSVIRADNLEHAVKIVNQTGYGLTSGIESLDERELDYWKQNIVAGNLYINRGTTGAIVLRQPFGGFGKSAVGMGRKVGTFNYITQFMNVKEISKPTVWEAKTGKLVKLLERMDTQSRHSGLKEDIQKLRIALQSYLFCLEDEFLKERDFCRVRGEDNVFRYRKLGSVAIRICKGDGFFDSVARILAARVCGVKIHVSFEPDDVASISQYLFRYSKKILREEDSIKTESEDSFAEGFAFVDRIFYAKSEKVSEFVYKQAAKHLKFVVCQPPLMEGRLELLNFFEEQSISHSYHRYGNPGRRALVEEN